MKGQAYRDYNEIEQDNQWDMASRNGCEPSNGLAHPIPASLAECSADTYTLGFFCPAFTPRGYANAVKLLRNDVRNAFPDAIKLLCASNDDGSKGANRFRHDFVSDATCR